MRLWLSALLIGLVPGSIAGAAGEAPPHYVAIHVPGGVKSEQLFIRYMLAGEEIGGLVQARGGVTDYLIATTRGERVAAWFRAVLYAPGCAIQTIDVTLPDAVSPTESFICTPLGNVRIVGRVVDLDRLSGHDVRVQAKYLARWAGPFLGMNSILAIPMGGAVDLGADGRFQLLVPDLAHDPLAGAGELQIQATDKEGNTLAQLIPTEADEAARTGGIPVQAAYPGEIGFAACSLQLPRVLIHREGFAQRRPDACQR